MDNPPKRAWATPAAAGLLKKMLSGQPLTPDEQQVLAEIKRSDPPKPGFGQPPPDSPPSRPPLATDGPESSPPSANYSDEAEASDSRKSMRWHCLSMFVEPLPRLGKPRAPASSSET